MRLKKLTLQAFGPFKDKVIIDFEKDNIDKGLLLISGDTGAGKTTIFDAICYALYGKTSSEVRIANSLRSDWATDDTETYVELEFYYKNKLYEVKRTPEYNRKKKNGTGETKQVATAEIVINDRFINKVNDVTKEIENLIGLDYKQFRQVAMLSQGEFTKFLLASSDEKTTIFRKIFETNFYDILQNKLKSNRLLKEEEIKRVKDKIDTEIKKIENIVNIYGLNDDEIINVLDSKIKEDSESVLLTKIKRDKKNEEKMILNTDLKLIIDLNKKIIDYQNFNKELDELLKNNENIDSEINQYNYNIDIARIITEILNSLKKDKKLLLDKEEKNDLYLKQLEEKQKEFLSKEEKFNSLNNYSKNVDNLNYEINELSNQVKKYIDFIDKQKELKNIEEEYKNNSNNYDIQNSIYENMRQKYYLNISVELADMLKDNQPCPVCGSINHPMKAISNSCEFTKEDLQKEENKLKEIDNLRKRNEARIEQIRKIITDFNILDDLDVIKEIDSVNNCIVNKQKEKQELEKEFNKLSKEKEKLNSDINSLKDNIEILKSDIKVLENSIEEATSLLDKTYEDNNTNYSEYEDKLLDNISLNLLRNKINSYNSKKQELTSKIKLLEKDVKDKKIIDASLKEKQLDIISKEYRELDDMYTKLNSQLDKLKDSTNNIKKYMIDNKKVENEYAVIKILSDTANGSLTGVKRVTFENYVQSYFMNTVLVEANKRLIKMTDSRFELKKKEIQTKLNVKTGLDFSIFDSYTGKERDVASLSGGEKFKASLALALGLSDTISNNRGGIKIDSLFIDEGFGSLDSESLNQALNILADLSGNDKLVGVISHVSELMSRIDNKILVNKTNTGSVVNIEANN